MSEISCKYRRLSRLFYWLSVCVTIVPFIIYFFVAFVNAEVEEKVVLGLTFTAAMIITIINVLAKASLRSAIWIILIGIYYVLSDITVIIIVTGVTTILDELVFTPLHHKYKELFRINKEIDKRVCEKN